MVKLEPVPFFKILLPYIAGILLVMQTGHFAHQHHIFYGVAALLLLSFLLMSLVKAAQKKFFKVLYLLAVNAFLVLLACETTFYYTQTNDPQHYSHYLKSGASKIPVTGTVYDMPVQTEKFVKLPLKIDAIYNGHTWQQARGTTIVYADKRAYASIGLRQRIALNAGFSIVQPPANPYEFDYAAYLKDRNIVHVVFAKAGDIQVLQSKPGVSFNSIGPWLKAQTIGTLRHSGLSQEAFSICSALLVGYDDEIDNSVMNSFSHSGTLHVLSVSGLHTSILYAIIIALFGFFDKYNRYKKLKCFLILACMALLMAITGFAPAVCRAVVMLSLVLVGNTFFNKGNSFNTLFVSAFILLLFNPLLLKDLGFLLSYFAVFGIMYLYPRLSALYEPRYKLVKWMLDSTLLSVSATLFTLPISLFYFHQFPTWFIVSNLLIIPISIVIMLGALLLLTVHKVLMLKTGIAFAINALTAFMIWCSQLSNKPGTGYIDLIHFTGADITWMSLCVMLLLALINRKRFVYACSLGITIIAWLFSSTYNVVSDYKTKELIVFKTKHGNSLLIKHGKTIYYAGDSLAAREFDRTVKPYLQHINYDKLVLVHHRNYARVGKQSICLPDHPVSAPLAQRLNISTWIISRQQLRHDKAFGLSGIERLIATGGNKRTYLEKLRQQCAISGVAFHSVYTDGAFRTGL